MAASKEAEAVLAEVEVSAKEAEVVKAEVIKIKDAAEVLVARISADKEVAMAKLEGARPALEEAEAALNVRLF